MAEISHSASGPLAKGLEFLSFSDRNTCLSNDFFDFVFVGMPVLLTTFKSLADASV